VHHLLAKGYPIEPRSAYFAILDQRRGLYDSLIQKIDDLDSIVGVQGHILAAICDRMYYENNPSELHPYDWFFQDLLDRGVNPDPKFLTEPSTCPGDPSLESRSKRPVLDVCITQAPDRFARMLIEAGAGPNIRYCLLGDSKVRSTLEAGHSFPATTRSPTLGAYMDSVAIIRGQEVP